MGKETLPPMSTLGSNIEEMENRENNNDKELEWVGNLEIGRGHVDQLDPLHSTDDRIEAKN